MALAHHRLVPLLAAAVAACAHAPPAPAPGAAPPAAVALRPPAGVAVAIDVAERGTLVFQVPSGWKATSGEARPPLPASLRFEPPAGHHLLLVTPLWDPERPDASLGPEVARALAEETRDRALETAVEGSLPLVALQGASGAGWYFACTDRALATRGGPTGPDEYRAMVQGVLSTGSLLLAFTLLDDGDGPHRAEALALVQGAELRRPAGDPAAEPERATRPLHADPSRWPVRGREPLELGLPGRAWTIQLDLEGWRVADPMTRYDGSATSVIAHRESDGMVLTTTVSESAGRRSAEGCRDRDWPRIEATPGVVPGPRSVRGGVASVGYAVGTGPDATSHLSTWYYREGVCIHVHASVEGAPPADPAALERATRIRFGEPL